MPRGAKKRKLVLLLPWLLKDGRPAGRPRARATHAHTFHRPPSVSLFCSRVLLCWFACLLCLLPALSSPVLSCRFLNWWWLILLAGRSLDSTTDPSDLVVGL